MKFLSHGNFEQAQQCFFRPTKAFSQFNHSLYKYSLQLLHTQVDALLLGIDFIIYSNFSSFHAASRGRQDGNGSLPSTKEATKKGKGPPLRTVSILLWRECTAQTETRWKFISTVTTEPFKYSPERQTSNNLHSLWSRCWAPCTSHCCGYCSLGDTCMDTFQVLLSPSLYQFLL